MKSLHSNNSFQKKKKIFTFPQPIKKKINEIIFCYVYETILKCTLCISIKINNLLISLKQLTCKKKNGFKYALKR